MKRIIRHSGPSKLSEGRFSSPVSAEERTSYPLPLQRLTSERSFVTTSQPLSRAALQGKPWILPGRDRRSASPALILLFVWVLTSASHARSTGPKEGGTHSFDQSLSSSHGHRIASLSPLGTWSQHRVWPTVAVVAGYNSSLTLVLQIFASYFTWYNNVSSASTTFWCSFHEQSHCRPWWLSQFHYF